MKRLSNEKCYQVIVNEEYLNIKIKNNINCLTFIEIIILYISIIGNDCID